MCLGIGGFFVFWILLLSRMYLPPHLQFWNSDFDLTVLFGGGGGGGGDGGSVENVTNVASVADSDAVTDTVQSEGDFAQLGEA